MDQIINLYVDEKKSISAIANQLNLGYKKIRNYLIKNNIKLRKTNTIGLHTHSSITKEKMRNKKIGDKNPMFGICSDETKKLLAYHREKIFSDPIKKKIIYAKVSETRKNKKLSVGEKNPMSNPNTVKKWAESNKLKPNKKELFLFNFLNENSLGNFLLNTRAEHVVINGKIPDLVDIKGKLIIEMYGDYWHKDETIDQQNYRKNIFKTIGGYETLIIWETELTNEIALKNKILNFLSN